MLALASSLLWYGALMNRIAAKDWEFIKAHSSARFFPVASYWWGNYFYFEKMDPASAIANYGEAVSRYSLFMDAWLDLAKAELSRGNVAEARRIISLTSPLIAEASYWKWKEILLAYDLQDEESFASDFNFILTRMPYRVQEACDLSRRFWGSWSGVAPHVSAQNRPVFISVLMTAKAVDEVFSVWEMMKADRDPLDKGLMLQICDFALNNGYVRQAKDVWNVWQPGEHFGVYDGGFDMPPVNRGFGWRIDRDAKVDIERTGVERYKGKHSLRIHFPGMANVSFYNVSQIVPVTPGGKYSLTFAHKSNNITTDQGVFLYVQGFRCEMAPVASRPILGTNPWEVERLDFAVPDSCEAVLLQVLRPESLKIDNRISGDYWLGSVELHLSPEKG